MKNIIVLFITVMILFSCGICRKYTSDDKASKKEDTKTETSKTEKESSEEVKKESTTKENKSNASVEMLNFDKSDLPSEIKYTGNIVTGKRWTDRNGENILILTKTGFRETRARKPVLNDYEKDCELYGYHYVNSGGAFSLLWKINDFVKECPLDLTLDFIPGSLSITDLNDNGIAESTFLYKMACRGDVSPSDLKLIMHENETKYALRGNMLVKVEGFSGGGSYKVDKAFDSAPDGFLDYAKTLWKEFKLETFK